MSKTVYDYIIIGSGFGGAVSALRLAQKGYDVLVLEAGKRYRSEDFPKTNRSLPRFLWLPKLRCFGILRMELLRHSLVLSGAGVGGGSLVYGNTLLVPPDDAWQDPQWRSLEDWRDVMPSYYETAQRMLGATGIPADRPADQLLKTAAHALGDKVAASFRPTRVGVYFGDEASPSEPHDPYFDGEGPGRSPCTRCGACMVGCRHGAKNTLDKNYLYFAERLGATVMPERLVTGVREHPDGGYEVLTERSTAWFAKDPKAFRARGVVFSAGALGTTRLLLSCKRRGLLPRLSNRLGHYVRTNSEAILSVYAGDDVNYGEGIAITSSVNLSDGTHVEVVTYNEGSDALSFLATLMVDGDGRWPRWFKFLGVAARRPLRFLRTLWPFGWARHNIILLCMQTKNNHLVLRLSGRSRLVSELAEGARAIPTYIPAAHELARVMARETGGSACGSIFEVLFDIPTTAHILGGAAMGKDTASGVIDSKNRVFGYDGMYVVDGSMIGANLGVNPSLTITALAERAMAAIPPKPGSREPDWSRSALQPAHSSSTNGEAPGGSARE